MKKEDWPSCHECEFFDEKKFYCKQFLRSVTIGCPNGETKKPRNNFERLKNMSMEELAEIIETLCPSWNWTLALNGKSLLEWLKEEI